MRGLAAAVLLLSSVTCAAGGHGVPVSSSQIERDVDLPEGGARGESTIMLTVNGVHFPAGQPAVIRVYAGAASDRLLGSFALLPESRGATGERVYPSFLVNVSKGLREAVGSAGDAGVKRVKLRFVPFEGKRLLGGLTWSIDEVSLTQRR